MINYRANIFLREIMAKTCPSCGYHEPDNQALYCNKCGRPFPQILPQNPVMATAPGYRPAPAAVRHLRRKNTGPAGFLSFDTLITRDYLRMIYILGAVVIILVSLVGITGGFAKPGPAHANTSVANASFINTTALAQDPAGSSLFWIGFLVIGSVLWRMFCELFIMLSRVHEAPGYGDETAPDYDPTDYGDADASVPEEEGPTQFVECPKCGKIVPVEELRECEHCGVQGCSNCIRMMGLLKKTMTCRECFEAK
jgi:hypothetical protein